MAYRLCLTVRPIPAEEDIPSLRSFLEKSFPHKDNLPYLTALESSPLPRVTARRLGALALLPALLEKEIVICNEVGSGVIPMDPKQRQSREMTGRLCILLAQRAEKVVRLICGIPQIIKE